MAITLLLAGNVVFLLLWIHSRMAYRKLLKLKLEKEEELFHVPSGTDFKSVQPQDYTDTQLLINLKHLFRKEKIFLEPDLGINDVAKKLGCSKAAVSKAINTHLHKNFPTLLNDYRIEESIRLLSDKETQNYKMEVISTMSGYKNRQVFHAAFKKATGITPNHFRDISRKETASSPTEI